MPTQVKMGIKVTGDNKQSLVSAIRDLVMLDVLVGVPERNAGRNDSGGHINNAELAYIHDNGAPEVNIPARPFMKPGIQKARSKIVDRFKSAGQAALDANPVKMRAELARAGMEAASSIKKVIQEGISPPITAAAVRSRRARRGDHSTPNPSELEYINMIHEGATSGALMGAGLVTPLIDTAGMLRSIDSEVRKRGTEAKRR